MKTLLLLSLMSGVLAAADLEDWKGIALIGGLDRISEIHIHNLLRAHDIECTIEGSLVYGIAVPATKAEEASRILRKDCRDLRYAVWFGSNDVVRAAERKQIISRSSVSSVLKKSEYGNATALGRFLRSKDILGLTAKYPYIFSLSVQKRQYLATPKAYSTGYDVEIELQKSLGESVPSYRGRYQVYDDGRQVESLGSNESRKSK
jgi:hypothetical protein